MVLSILIYEFQGNIDLSHGRLFSGDNFTKGNFEGVLFTRGKILGGSSLGGGRDYFPRGNSLGANLQRGIYCPLVNDLRLPSQP